MAHHPSTRAECEECLVSHRPTDLCYKQQRRIQRRATELVVTGKAVRAAARAWWPAVPEDAPLVRRARRPIAVVVGVAASWARSRGYW